MEWLLRVLKRIGYSIQEEVEFPGYWYFSKGEQQTSECCFDSREAAIEAAWKDLKSGSSRGWVL